jgi:hypothetical protein
VKRCSAGASGGGDQDYPAPLFVLAGAAPPVDLRAKELLKGLGQLMAHVGFLGEDQVERSLWDIEDDELLAVLHRHRRELFARQQAAPNQALQQTGGA